MSKPIYIVYQRNSDGTVVNKAATVRGSLSLEVFLNKLEANESVLYISEKEIVIKAV